MSASRVERLRIAGAEIEGRGPLDVRIAGGRVAEIAPALAARPEERCIDARGGALLPGLHDHHLHLLSLGAALASVPCGPPAVGDEAELVAALRAAASTGGWVRGVGYHESVAGPLDRDRLDAWVSDVPVRIQHRSGAAWILSSAALSAVGISAQGGPPGVERNASGRPTGRLFRLDAWLRSRLPAAAPPDLAAVGRLLSSVGITGVTDATPEPGSGALAQLAAARVDGSLPQRVRVMPAPGSEAGSSGLEIGPVKLLLDEPRLPDFGEAVARIVRAHAAGRAVAIHAVTRAELVFACSALAEAGPVPGDRLEHASVAPPPTLELIRELGVTVVTEPGFLWQRGDDYAREVEAADRPWLYRGRGFEEAGIPLAAGTDAPFADADPWQAMRTAVERRSIAGTVLGADEALSPERALALFTTPLEAPGGEPRRVEVGAPADLCLLRVPWSEARRCPSAVSVAATVVAGSPVWSADSSGRDRRAPGRN